MAAAPTHRNPSSSFSSLASAGGGGRISKVKFLCSFNGQIIPRPSDGQLRYAGGETRILTFRRDVALADVLNKVAEILGQPAALRYQLPDVDLDALVSVSTADDLENMMEEYDKLTESSPDGSAKLRVFLFTPSDVAAASDPVAKPRLDDTGQRYLDAVNGLTGDRCLGRKDSLASASSSTQEAAAAEGMMSPTVTNCDQFLFAVAPAGLNVNVNVPGQVLNCDIGSCHSGGNCDQSGLLLVGPPGNANPPHQDVPFFAPYAPYGYVDQNQVQYVNPLVNVGVGAGAGSPRSHVPSAVNSVVSLGGTVKVDSYVDENVYGGRAAQVQAQNDANYRAAYQTLSQLPPLPPTYLQPHSGDWFGLQPVLAQRPQGQQLRMADCNMCQKGLLHAHSDTVLQENGNGIGSVGTEVSGAVLHTAHSEDAVRVWASSLPGKGLQAESNVEPKPENIMPAGLYGSYVFSQVPETRHENEISVQANAEGSDHAIASRPPDAKCLPAVGQPSYGLFVNMPQSHYEASLRQQQQHQQQQQQQQQQHQQQQHNQQQQNHQHQHHHQQQSQPQQHQRQPQPQQHQRQLQPEFLVQPQVLLRPDMMNAPYVNGVYPVRNISCQPVEQLTRCSVVEPLYDYARPVNVMMESLRVTPYENSGYYDCWKQIVTTSNTGAGKELKPEGPPLVQNNHPVRQQQVGGDSVLASKAFTNPGIIPEGNYVRTADITSSVGFTELHNIQSDAVKELKPENPPLLPDNHLARQQVGEDAVFMSNAFANPGIIPDGNYVRASEQLLPSSAGFTESHNLQSSVSTQVVSFSQETGPEPMVSNGRLHVNPVHSCGIDPTHSNHMTNNIPTGIKKDEASQDLKDSTNDLLCGISSGTVPLLTPSTNGINGHVELFQGQVPSEPLLYNHDPTPILVNTNILAPLPPTVACKDFATPKDLLTEDLVVRNKGPDVTVLSAEGVFHQPPNSMVKDPCQEHPIRSTRVEGSGDEQNKQELQVHGEGVAASVHPSSVTMVTPSILPSSVTLVTSSVLPSSVTSVTSSVLPSSVTSVTSSVLPSSVTSVVSSALPSSVTSVVSSVLPSSVTPVPVFAPCEPTPQPNLMDDSPRSAAALGDPKIEDIKTRQADKVNIGFPIGEEIGRLQIINNNDLEELRELGSGTFGTVYHGKWRGSDVAIKRINDRCFVGKPSEQERMRADFWNEACNLADLHHPNVVAFYGVVLDGPGGSVATVTEYMANGSLRHALQKNDKSLDLRKRLLIAMDVAFGMEYLHGKNIVHFDLKSDNLLVNLRDPQRPICKVGDLGLSKVKCHTLISGGVRGTLPWMAPELLNGSSSLVSEKVDVFSFGIVMWELLTGKEPYADLHYGLIIGGIVNNTLRPPIPESCGPEWRSLMEKCWSADPSERPTFTEIASGLRAIAVSLPPKGK